MAEKASELNAKPKGEVVVEEVKVEIREKRSRKSYEDRDDGQCREVATKTLRKTFLHFLTNPRESVLSFIKEVRKLDYKKLMDAYFTVYTDDTMNI